MMINVHVFCYRVRKDFVEGNISHSKPNFQLECMQNMVHHLVMILWFIIRLNIARIVGQIFQMFIEHKKILHPIVKKLLTNLLEWTIILKSLIWRNGKYSISALALKMNFYQHSWDYMKKYSKFGDRIIFIIIVWMRNKLFSSRKKNSFNMGRNSTIKTIRKFYQLRLQSSHHWIQISDVFPSTTDSLIFPIKYNSSERW